MLYLVYFAYIFHFQGSTNPGKNPRMKNENLLKN